MTWEAAASIAETVGAFGVIFSLIYLANQVRNENRASAVAAKLESTRLLSDLQDMMILHPELMELLLKARKGTGSLSDRERHVFSNMCLKTFWFTSASYFQLRMKTLSATSGASESA
ncbi:MAG: hypothetical protein AB7T59_17115 [Hyphomonadaceae bacterium]